MHLQKHLRTAIIIGAVIMGAGTAVPTQAAPAVTATATIVSEDMVRLQVTGEPNSAVALSFLRPGAATSTIVANFGRTDSLGVFSTTVSSGAYGIQPGAQGTFSIAGQHAAISWPQYIGSLILGPSSVRIMTGRGVTVTSTHPVFIATNTNPEVIIPTIGTNQITVVGKTAGTGQLLVCAGNAGCRLLDVTVSNESQTEIQFSQNNFQLGHGQTQFITLFGGLGQGYYVSSNSNPGVIAASLSGNTLMLTRGQQSGPVTITVCAQGSMTNCAQLQITSAATSSVPAPVNLALSKNNVALPPSHGTAITIAGGPTAQYQVVSHSDPAVASIVFVGDTMTLWATMSGNSVLQICHQSGAPCSMMHIAVGFVVPIRP